jgi:glutathione S-transferase
MDYKTVAEAKDLPGLRLALTVGGPAPWSQAAKSIFQVKKIPYIPVAQYGGQANEDLVAWTGHRNAPVAMYEKEPARTGWYEILLLAERLVPTPALLPQRVEDRALMIGLSNELCGEEGFTWQARHIMFDALLKTQGDAFKQNPMFRAYGYSAQNAAAAPAKMRPILDALSARLHRQQGAGSRYFVGDGLTALDLYWANMSQVVVPYPPEKNPMPDFFRQLWAPVRAAVESSIDPLLIAHRDFIFTQHLTLPLDF